MRDLVEVSHQHFIWNHPCFYKVNSFFELKLSDYYYMYVREYVMDIPHNVTGKAPWTYINFYSSDRRDAGWKIHISSEVDTHIEVLKLVAHYACKRKIDFKFSTNLNQFIDINSKNIARASSGKFIVLYPLENEFSEVIEDLYKLLKSYQGPYILSDKQYKDSKVVFYRYGEINPIRFVDEYGTITTRIMNKNNLLEVDKRQAFYSKPEWVPELFSETLTTKESKLLKKYSIEKAIHFTAQGGVYIADCDNKTCIIKEARAFAGIDNNKNYGTDRLKKEYEILESLVDTKTVPVPIELIEEFDNTYLIEEYIEGESLRSYPHKHSPYVNHVSDNERMKQIHKEFAEELDIIIEGILSGVSKLHKKQIALGDISPANIIYNRDLRKISFVDLETAFYFEKDKVGNPDMLLTPGFSTTRCDKTMVEIELFKIGLVFLYLIEPYNAYFHLSEKKIEETLELFKRKTVVPSKVFCLIEGLINFKFKSAELALDMFKNNSPEKVLEKPVERYEINYDKIYDAICKNITNAKYHKKDVLSTDPMGLVTNQYCFSYGVFGILYAMKKYNGLKNKKNLVEHIVHDFMREFYYNPKSFSRGLFVGLSGIAYCLMELGFKKEATLVIEEVLHRESAISDYAYGSAGVIPVLLSFYKNIGEEKYIEAAMKEADSIMAKAKIERGGLEWKDTEEDRYSGLTRGGSGIALAFLQLYLVTQDPRYLAFGEMAMDGELRKLQVTDKGFLGIDSRVKGGKIPVFSPYIHNGVAGIGCVLVRYYKVTGKEQYLEIINELLKACIAEFVLFTGYLRGAVGLQSFYQDCFYILNMEKAQENIDLLDESLSYHYVEKDETVGFAGDELYKISHDLHTGSAGVLLNIDRCKNKKSENSFLIFDEIFENS